MYTEYGGDGGTHKKNFQRFLREGKKGSYQIVFKKGDVEVLKQKALTTENLKVSIAYKANTS